MKPKLLIDDRPRHNLYENVPNNRVSTIVRYGCVKPMNSLLKYVVGIPNLFLV